MIKKRIKTVGNLIKELRKYDLKMEFEVEDGDKDVRWMGIRKIETTWYNTPKNKKVLLSLV